MSQQRETGACSRQLSSEVAALPLKVSPSFSSVYKRNPGDLSAQLDGPRVLCQRNSRDGMVSVPAQITALSTRLSTHFMVPALTDLSDFMGPLEQSWRLSPKLSRADQGRNVSLHNTERDQNGLPLDPQQSSTISRDWENVREFNIHWVLTDTRSRERTVSQSPWHCSGGSKKGTMWLQSPLQRLQIKKTPEKKPWVMK